MNINKPNIYQWAAMAAIGVGLGLILGAYLGFAVGLGSAVLAAGICLTLWNAAQ